MLFIVLNSIANIESGIKMKVEKMDYKKVKMDETTFEKWAKDIESKNKKRIKDEIERMRILKNDNAKLIDIWKYPKYNPYFLVLVFSYKVISSSYDEVTEILIYENKMFKIWRSTSKRKIKQHKKFLKIKSYFMLWNNKKENTKSNRNIAKQFINSVKTYVEGMKYLTTQQEFINNGLYTFVFRNKVDDIISLPSVKKRLKADYWKLHKEYIWNYRIKKWKPWATGLISTATISSGIGVWVNF